MQNKIQAVIKKKLRYPKHMTNDALYAHEHAGGKGLDKIKDLVNVNRLMLLVACLDQGGEMEIIMRGAIERLRIYAGTNGCPLQQDVTTYTKDRPDMWLYQLKKWMETQQITINSQYKATHSTKSIIETCTRKTHRDRIWQWVRRTGNTQISDIVHADSTWREDTMPNGIRTQIQGQIPETQRLEAACTLDNKPEIATGRWIKRDNSGAVGKIIKHYSTHAGARRNYYQVQTWAQEGRKWTQKCNERWRKSKCEEVKITTKHEVITQVKQVREHDNRGINSEDEHQHSNNINKGLYNYFACPTRLTDLHMRASDNTQSICIASDGTVTDQQMGGAYAWHIFTKDQFGQCIPWQIEGVGREHIGTIIVGLTPEQRPLDTMEAHSYRMEALALLSGLVFMRVDIKWQGHITWYTDSQAVIDTSKKVTWYNMTCWINT